MKDLFRTNKFLAKAKSESVTLKYQAFNDLSDIKLVAYIDSSFGNLTDHREICDLHS